MCGYVRVDGYMRVQVVACGRVRFPGAGVAGSCELTWELWTELHPLKEQQALLTAESALQALETKVLKESGLEGRETAQLFRALDPLLEDLGLIPASAPRSVIPVAEDQTSSSDLGGHDKHLVRWHKYEQSTHAHRDKRKS